MREIRNFYHRTHRLDDRYPAAKVYREEAETQKIYNELMEELEEVANDIIEASEEE